jgi:signal transduction histidine kinase
MANLLLALTLTAALAMAFVFVTRRTTRPLEELTGAAMEVGAGNFIPNLPKIGDDEVGRLTSAFATMSGQIERTMAELQTSQQMAAVGSFAKQIAHEIRNPLTSIKLNLQSLERDAHSGLVPSDSRRTVEICLEEIQRLDRVVRGVLSLGKTPSNGQRTIPLGAIVARALDVVGPQLVTQHIALQYDPPAGDFRIVAAEEQLVGMFLNLFMNAVDAMPEGGVLLVRIERFDRDGLPPAARVLISDTGPGVPADSQRRIFEPFFTTKKNGSGLGLATAARDVEQHRGRLSLIDGTARGATFSVELPLAPAQLGRA